MTVPTDNLPRHKDDFDRVYDLEDPSPYFTSLRPSDYRMPAVLASALTAIHPSVRASARAWTSGCRRFAATLPGNGGQTTEATRIAD